MGKITSVQKYRKEPFPEWDDQMDSKEETKDEVHFSFTGKATVVDM